MGVKNLKVERQTSDEDIEVDGVGDEEPMDFTESDPLMGNDLPLDGDGQEDGALPLQITSVSTLSKVVPKKVGRFSQAFADMQQNKTSEATNGDENSANATKNANGKALAVVTKVSKDNATQKQKPQIKLEPAKSQELVPVNKSNKSMREIKEAKENANKDSSEANKTNGEINNETALVPAENAAKRRRKPVDMNNNIKTRNSPVPQGAMNGTRSPSVQIAGKENMRAAAQVTPVVMGKSDAKKNLNATLNKTAPGVVKPIGTVASLTTGASTASPKILPNQALTKVSSPSAQANGDPKVLPSIPSVVKKAGVTTPNGVVKSLPKQPLTVAPVATKVKPVTKIEPGTEQPPKKTTEEATGSNNSTPVKNLPNQQLKKATVSLIKLKDFSKYSSANAIVKSEKKDDNIAS